MSKMNKYKESSSEKFHRYVSQKNRHCYSRYQTLSFSSLLQQFDIVPTKARNIIRSLRDVVVYRFGWLTKYMKSNVCRLNVQESYSGCEENPESKQRVLSRFFRVSSRDQARS